MISLTGKFLVGPAAALVLLTATFAFAAATATPADLDFVAHVSQGGSYEVAAGKVAEMRGQTPDIRDLGVMEAHDHTLVNDKLKQIASATGAPFPSHLNAEFQQRLDKLKAVPAAKFDAYFLARFMTGTRSGFRMSQRTARSLIKNSPIRLLSWCSVTSGRSTLPEPWNRKRTLRTLYICEAAF
jgi:predicted outer membrane protein